MTIWRDEFQIFREELRAILFTHAEFTNKVIQLIDISDSPIEGILFEWDSPSIGEKIILGRKCERREDYSERNDELHTNISIWIQNKPDINGEYPNVTEIAREMWYCFREFALLKELNPKSHIRDYKNSQRIATLLERRVSRCFQEINPFAFLFLDLDGFKQVNDNIGYDQGDIVIQRFAGFLEKTSAQNAIILHNGGDEFIIFYPDADPEKGLQLAIEIISKSKKFNFDSRGVNITVSIGIAYYSEHKTYNSLSEIIIASESALKIVKKTKKGTVRFPDEVKKDLLISEKGLRLAICVTKTSIGSKIFRVYSNPWLNILLNNIYFSILENEFNIDEIPKIVAEYLESTNIEINNSILCAQQTNGEEVFTSPTISLLDIGFAISGGIFTAALKNELFRSEIADVKIEINSEKCTLITAKKKIIWLEGESKGVNHSIDLGSCWSTKELGDINESSGRIALIVQIGHEKIELPKSIIAELVLVDDRPTRGGGLPDFWELTLGRILYLLNLYKNVKKIFIIGESKWGRQSVERLTKTDEWDNRYIEYKTTLPMEVIEKGKEKLNGNVHLIRNLDELLEIILPEIRKHQQLIGYEKNEKLEYRGGLISREIRMDKIMLTQENGCRVESIAKAYIIVLELLRRYIPKDGIILDQSAKPLTELLDYKIELLEPIKDMIPDFYKGDQKQIEEYYVREFRTKGGIFWEELQKYDQYKKVKNHVAETLSLAPKPFSTRRAILVIPHIPPKDTELAPLGLIAIRCSPRILGSNIILNFSFVWRTVEVLVGLPYSLYGSVKFASDMTSDIEIIMKSKGNNNSIKIGSISYIALSLHMFRDEFAMQIARKIVNDATT